MKKILAVLLATSSVAVFADTFQDFNNNLYAQYTYLSTTLSENGNASANANGYGIGGTFQSKDDVWANVSINNYKAAHNADFNAATAANGDGGFSDSTTVTNIKAGYAFQFFGDDDSGFQVVPYASFGATDSADYSWGAGVLPQYRLMSSLMVGLGLGLQGMTGQNNQGNDTTVFAFNVNPEVQYDIAKTILLSVGYNYQTTFNNSPTITTNAVTAKVGYLF